MSIRERVTRAVEGLSPFPTGAVQLAGLLQDPAVDPEDVVREISFDPGLTAFVLSTANSAAFGVRAEVSTVREAWLRLGSGRVLAAVVSRAISTRAQSPVEGYNVRGGALWEAAVGTALATEELARILGWRAPAEAFCAALLTDLGKTVLGAVAGEQIQATRTLALTEELSFELAEKRVLGIDHAEVGALMLANWGLPDGLVQVTRWHHRPTGCPEEHRRVAELVHVAQHICSVAGLGGGDDGLRYQSCAQTLDRIGVSREVTERCLFHAITRLGQAREAFGVRNGAH